MVLVAKVAGYCFIDPLQVAKPHRAGKLLNPFLADLADAGKNGKRGFAIGLAGP